MGVISITTAVSEGAKASSIVVSTVVASGAVIVASMAVADSMVQVAGSMAVATEADTGKISSSWSKDEDGWQHPCQPFSFSEVLSPGILCRTVRAMNLTAKTSAPLIWPFASVDG
jgi:hypothetical protein